MNILVCSRGVQYPDWGHVDSSNLADDKVEFFGEETVEPDAILSMSISKMEDTFNAMEKYPNATLYCYNWDCYAWVWCRPREYEYDYHKYGELLAQAKEIWVPSKSAQVRTLEWWNLTSEVIHSSCDIWPLNQYIHTGEKYILCTLREIPDPHWDLIEALKKVSPVPVKMTKHSLELDDYRRTVTNASCIVSHCYELSTGGLSLVEGYAQGVPPVISSCPWNAGQEYLKKDGYYFQEGDLGSMIRAIDAAIQAPKHQGNVEAMHRLASDYYSHTRMLNDIARRVHNGE